MSTERPRRPRPSERGLGRRAPMELSAGGVVVRAGEAIVIVPRRRAADGRSVLALPKGHVDEGESVLQAAMREVREETGVQVEHLCHLGRVRYWYMRDRERVTKAVEFYLFRYLGGDTADHDDEVEEVLWMPIDQAARALTYEAEREIVRRAAAALGSPAAGKSAQRRQDR